MKKIIRNKRVLELVTSLLFRLWNKFRNIPQLVMYYLTKFDDVLSDQIWWCNIKQFLSYYKKYICKFMKANSWHHKLFDFHLSIWIWKAWKGRKKNYKNLNISRTERAFSIKWKTFFIVFEGLSFGEKWKFDKK